MSETEIKILILEFPFILAAIYIGLIAIVAIFFYKDSETDKVQLEYLEEKEREERRKAIEN